MLSFSVGVSTSIDEKWLPGTVRVCIDFIAIRVVENDQAVTMYRDMLKLADLKHYSMKEVNSMLSARQVMTDREKTEAMSTCVGFNFGMRQNRDARVFETRDRYVLQFQSVEDATSFCEEVGCVDLA